MLFRSSFIYFFRFREHIYAKLDSDKDIYRIDSEVPIASLAGDGTQPYSTESILTFVEDTGETKINYNIYSVSPVLGGSYVAIIYSYKGKLMMEIKDKDLKTVYVSDFTKVPGFERFYEKKYARTSGHYFPIQNDIIYFMALEDEEYKLFRFAIREACTEN